MRLLATDANAGADDPPQRFPDRLQDQLESGFARGLFETR